MKPPRPSAIVTLAGRRLTAEEAGLTALRARLSRGSHDVMDLQLWPKSKFAGAAPADTLSVQIGFKGEEEDVWAGEVTAVSRSAHAVHITGHARTVALSRERKSRTYLSQTVADIVRDLASAVDVDQVDGASELSYYAVDHRRSVWGHLLDLASLTGSEITCSGSGALRFRPIAPLASATRFRYGAEVLSWQVATAAHGPAPVFAAHGSASESGAEKWHWVSPDPTGGAGGSQVVGAFHARSLGEALSNAAAKSAERAGISGQVQLVGQPALRAGDVFSLADLPGGDPGPVRALAVVHLLDATRGFRTAVSVEGAGA